MSRKWTLLVIGAALAAVNAYRRVEFLPESSDHGEPAGKKPGKFDSYTLVRVPVDIQGSARQKLVKFGRMLQRRNYQVTEQKEFGGVTPNAHEPGSPHLSDNAIDVNKDDADDEGKALDQIVGLARRYGLRTIWRHRGRDHAHFDTRGGPDS